MGSGKLNFGEIVCALAQVNYGIWGFTVATILLTETSAPWARGGRGAVLH